MGDRSACTNARRRQHPAHSRAPNRSLPSVGLVGQAASAAGEMNCPPMTTSLLNCRRLAVTLPRSTSGRSNRRSREPAHGRWRLLQPGRSRHSLGPSLATGCTHGQCAEGHGQVGGRSLPDESSCKDAPPARQLIFVSPAPGDSDSKPRPPGGPHVRQQLHPLPTHRVDGRVVRFSSTTPERVSIRASRLHALAHGCSPFTGGRRWLRFSADPQGDPQRDAFPTLRVPH